MDKKILAIIPARGGSKGLPRKNIKILNGMPLIKYTIDAAKNSSYIDRVIVSTEDKEIGDVSKECGAEIPFLRPEELAKDDTPSIDVILDCIERLEVNENYKPDYICLLQCTSPLRNSRHIDEAVNKLFEENTDSIVSVTMSEVSPYIMKKIENGKLVDFMKTDKKYTRRQDMPDVYALNGAIYIIKTDKLKELKAFYTENTVPYVMDAVSSIDIDNIIDFKFAELLIKEGYYE